ncbi:hypothetical protein SORBI_3002G100300 [Sorghum bicolor]|uniref:Uncharacterized protein n=1 Tax=Sorghum bicolor TaxID=4558 RepID=A0A1W0W394_SORBI|nr:hypothetical protein SORBI_3002G100300 [Sorghum bicolor]
MDSGAKRTRIAEEEQRDVDDHISRLPDAILGEIVSLLPTKDGGRTQAIASRWRHLWRSAPLNLDLHDRRIPPAQVSGRHPRFTRRPRPPLLPEPHECQNLSETSLNAVLAGCPLLQSLMLTESIGCKCIRIVSPTLRSIGVRVCWGDILLDQLIIEDAPSLERFILLGYLFHTEMFISVISAPKLKILGQLHYLQGPTLEFGNSVFKGSSVVNSTTVLPTVKVLALTHISLSLDEVIAFMRCFPCLENMYIKISTAYRQVTNAWRQKYRNLISTLDIRLKKIVLSTYLGNKAHVNFVSFFVLNARVLESMVLELDVRKNHDKEWIEKQKTLLQLEQRASRGVQFGFVYHFVQLMRTSQCYKNVQFHFLHVTV